MYPDRSHHRDDSATLYGSRDDRFEVMERVWKIWIMPLSISTVSEPSRTLITKDVARAFKTRVALEGSFRKYHTQYGQEGTANRWFEEVVATANQIQGYSLRKAPTRTAICFTENTHSTEVILAVTLDANFKFLVLVTEGISPTYGNRPSLTRVLSTRI